MFLDVLLTSQNFLAGSQKFALGWVRRSWARLRRSFGPAAQNFGSGSLERSQKYYRSSGRVLRVCLFARKSYENF